MHPTAFGETALNLTNDVLRRLRIERIENVAEGHEFGPVCDPSFGNLNTS